LQAKVRELRDSEIDQITTAIFAGNPAATLIDMAVKHDGARLP
jgi:hypothetical protein